MMAKAIQSSRPEFEYIHGGIVNSHDILGQRLGNQISLITNLTYHKKYKQMGCVMLNGA